MTKIILAGHGETEWNVAEIFRGRIDVELNETGIKQAELLAEYLSDTKIKATYSSPLKRASSFLRKYILSVGFQAKLQVRFRQ